jgi:hypothetical protein
MVMLMAPRQRWNSMPLAWVEAASLAGILLMLLSKNGIDASKPSNR